MRPVASSPPDLLSLALLFGSCANRPSFLGLGPPFLSPLALGTRPNRCLSCPFTPQQSRAGPVTRLRPPRRAQVLLGKWPACPQKSLGTLHAQAAGSARLGLRGAYAPSVLQDKTSLTQNASVLSLSWCLRFSQRCLPLKICLEYLLMHFNRKALLSWEL